MNFLAFSSSNAVKVTGATTKEKLNDPNVQFIDVRDKESFSKGSIGNAIHMDRGFLEFYLAVLHFFLSKV